MQLIVLVAIHVSRIRSPFYLFSRKLCSHLSSTCQETLTLWWPIPSKEQSLPQSETPLRWNFPRLSSLDGLSVRGFEGLARQPSGIWRNCNPGFTEIRVPHLAVECGGLSENKPCNLVLLMFITKAPWWRFIRFAYQHINRVYWNPAQIIPSPPQCSLQRVDSEGAGALDQWRKHQNQRCEADVFKVLRDVSRDSFWMLQIGSQTDSETIRSDSETIRSDSETMIRKNYTVWFGNYYSETIRSDSETKRSDSETMIRKLWFA